MVFSGGHTWCSTILREINSFFSTVSCSSRRRRRSFCTTSCKSLWSLERVSWDKVRWCSRIRMHLDRPLDATSSQSRGGCKWLATRRYARTNAPVDRAYVHGNLERAWTICHLCSCTCPLGRSQGWKGHIFWVFFGFCIESWLAGRALAGKKKWQ